MNTRSFRSFAKINLGLEVVGRRPDGYHQLRTIFAALSLHDVVHLTPGRSGIRVRCDHPEVPTDETNLAHRAALVMQRISGRKGVGIRIEKRIPPGGGLGGGSSNAATVLRALDMIWGLGLGPHGLLQAARMIGADVPYFLFGGLALGLGRGDEIQPLDISIREGVLLVPGSGGVSTAAVFKRFAASTPTSRAPSRIDALLRSSTDPHRPQRPWSSLRNDLERAARQTSTPLAAKARLMRRIGRSTGAVHVAMSGSGSSFFLLFDHAAGKREAAAALLAQGVPSVPCSFLSSRACRQRFEVRN